MNNDQKKVLMFINRTCKHLLHKPSTSWWYMNSLPCDFVNYTIDSKQPDPGVWNIMFGLIPLDVCATGRHRCIQAIFEFANRYNDNALMIFSQITRENAMSLRKALAFFNVDKEERTCEWLRYALSIDYCLFNKIIYRILSGCFSLRTCAAFKRSLAYYVSARHTSNEKIFVSGHNISIIHMWRIRQAFEHVHFGNHQIDDFVNRGAPLACLIDPGNAYKNSAFTYNELKVPKQKDILIKGRDRNLVLYGQHDKNFPLQHYRAALEMVSNEKTVFLDERLSDHLLLREPHFLFDMPVFLEQPPKDYNLCRLLTTRLNDFNREQLFESNSKEEEEEVLIDCQKMKLLQPTGDDDYESNVNSVNCHVKDFLLWMLIQNPSMFS